MRTYPPLTTITFSVTFTRTTDDVRVDPTDVFFRVQFQSYPVTSYSYLGAQVQRAGVGEYYVDFTPDQEGQWRCAWQGTGEVRASTLDTIFRVMQTDLID